MTEIAVGSLWQRKRGGSGHHADIVEVTHVTAVNVSYKERAPDVYRKPIAVFLGMFEPVISAEANGGLPWCKRCGDFRVRELGHKYCRYCVKEVVFRTVTTPVQDSPVRIVARPTKQQQEEVKADMPNAQSQELVHWRVLGQRIVVKEETYEIDAVDLLGLAGELDALAPGLQIVQIERLERNGNGHT